MRPDGQWGPVVTALHRFGVARSTSSALTRPLRWLAWGAWLSLLACQSPTDRSGRARTLGRLWGWQAWRRTVRRPIEVVLPTGRLWFPPWSTLAGITAAAGMHEPAEQLFVRSYLQPGDGVVDVGANVGIYTVMCGTAGARVWAFEPSTQARAALNRNIDLNHLGARVKLFPVALGASNGRASLTTGLDGANHLVDLNHAVDAAAPDAHETVELRPLDSIVDAERSWFGESGIALLKVDAEGHDQDVLRGADATIRGDLPVIIVETWAGGTSLRTFLAERGYRVYRFDVARRDLVEYPPDWAGQANFIAVADRRLAAVRSRLQAGTQPEVTAPVIHWRTPAHGSRSSTSR